MANTVPKSSAAPERPSLADVCGKPIKAELHPHTGAPRLRDVAAEALERMTTQKGAASDIGIDRSRLSHKLQDGSLTLKQLEALGPKFGERLGEVCRETFGEEDPQARIRRAIREARQKIDELAEAL